MKKALYSLIFISVFGLNSRASSADSIPNAGFETWFTTTWFDFPGQWTTSNNQLMATVLKDTNAYTGNYAMLLSNQGSIVPHATCDFPITSHPYNLGGYIKNQLITNDSVEIIIRIFYGQQLVDSGYAVFFGGINPNWSSFVVPISQNSSLADSCQISFIGGYVSGDGISFDDLEFDFSLNIPSISDYMVTVFPNPFTDYITINNPGNTELIFELYDMSGKRCMLKNATDVVILPRNHKLVNTESISSGSYVVILRNDDERHSITIMKN